jgi:hypothetical protein
MLTLLIVDQLILITLYSHAPSWRSAEVPSLANIGWSINYVRNMEMVERFHSCPNPNKCQFLPFISPHSISISFDFHPLPIPCHLTCIISYIHPIHENPVIKCGGSAYLSRTLQKTYFHPISFPFYSIPFRFILLHFYFISYQSHHFMYTSSVV